MPSYSIRDAGTSPDDVDFMVGAFDSTLPHLAVIGSGEMWGSVPFSQKDGFLQETRESVEQAEACRRCGSGGERVRIFIAEAAVSRADVDALAAAPGSRVHAREDTDGRLWLAVALACVREDWVPDYVASQPHLGLPTPDAVAQPLGGTAAAHAYLEVMIADHRTGQHHKGAGAFLLQHLRQLYREKGTRRLYVDAWAGNEKNLVKYYEQHGFELVGDFEMKRGNGTIWPGTLLCMELR